MGSRAMQLLDDVGDGLADPGDRAQAAFLDDRGERHRQRGNALRGAGIGASPVGIAAGERGAPRKLREERGDVGCIVVRHGQFACRHPSQTGCRFTLGFIERVKPARDANAADAVGIEFSGGSGGRQLRSASSKHAHIGA